MMAFAYNENLLYGEEMGFDRKYIWCTLVIFRQHILFSSIQAKVVYYFLVCSQACNSMSIKQRHYINRGRVNRRVNVGK